MNRTTLAPDSTPARGTARRRARWRPPAVRLTLLGRFLIVGTLTTASLAALTGFFLSRYLVSEALQQAVTEASMVTTHLITPRVNPAEFAAPTPETIAMWAGHMDHVIGHFSVEHIRIWNADGDVIFSEDADSIGVHSEADEIRQALSGRHSWKLVSREADDEHGPEEHQHLEIFIPITLHHGTDVLGAYQVARNHEPILAKIRRIRRSVWSASLLLFGLLFGSLFMLINRASRRLEHMAYHDSLTGLANRHQLRTRAEHAMTAARRSGTSIALLYLDLSRFKAVNDSLGHRTGDALLQQMAQRLRGCVRAGDTVARVGGDEFVILLDDFGANEALDRAEQVVSSLREAFVIGDQIFHVGVHVGGALFPRDASDWEELMNKADAAMYRAKSLRIDVQFFERDLVSYTRNRLQLEEELREALQREEFELYYQPVTALDGHRVVGVEALLRWSNPERGMVPPLEFIPLAEETGLIRDIDRYVVRHAVRQAEIWQREGSPLEVAVNLSAQSFADPHFTSWLTELLRSSDLDPRQLTLEITERVLVDTELARETLYGLAALGVRLALDDFGTGYSSLAYLESLPIDILKIDRSFIQGIEERPTAAGIAKTIVSLAENLGITVLAEGVENEEQLAWLVDHGCDLAQGYYLGRPQSAADLRRLPELPGNPDYAMKLN